MLLLFFLNIEAPPLCSAPDATMIAMDFHHSACNTKRIGLVPQPLQFSVSIAWFMVASCSVALPGHKSKKVPKYGHLLVSD
jgi:hypothetical protein